MVSVLNNNNWIVGPGIIGNESFDTTCIFGNRVEMNFNQMMLLRSYIEEPPRPAIKEYVCTLTESFIRPTDGQMVSYLSEIHNKKIPCIQLELAFNQLTISCCFAGVLRRVHEGVPATSLDDRAQDFTMHSTFCTSAKCSCHLYHKQCQEVL
jgi:hypothetical protein